MCRKINEFKNHLQSEFIHCFNKLKVRYVEPITNNDKTLEVFHDNRRISYVFLFDGNIPLTKRLLEKNGKESKRYFLYLHLKKYFNQERSVYKTKILRDFLQLCVRVRVIQLKLFSNMRRSLNYELVSILDNIE